MLLRDPAVLIPIHLIAPIDYLRLLVVYFYLNWNNQIIRLTKCEFLHQMKYGILMHSLF